MKSNKKKSWYANAANWIMDMEMLTIVWLAFSLVLLTPVIVFVISKVFNKDYGPIGDTLGGSTAPIIGFLSAILVYKSFKAQIDANNAVREESNFKYILDEFKSIKQTFNEFIYKNESTTSELAVTYVGIEGLKNLSNDLYTYYLVDFANNRLGGWDFNSALTNSIFLFKNYSIFINEVETLPLSESNRNIVESRIWLHFSEFLEQHFKTIHGWEIGELIPADREKHFKALELKISVGDLLSKLESFGETYSKIQK